MQKVAQPCRASCVDLVNRLEMTGVSGVYGDFMVFEILFKG